MVVLRTLRPGWWSVPPIPRPPSAFLCAFGLEEVASAPRSIGRHGRSALRPATGRPRRSSWPPGRRRLAGVGGPAATSTGPVAGRLRTSPACLRHLHLLDGGRTSTTCASWVCHRVLSGRSSVGPVTMRQCLVPGPDGTGRWCWWSRATGVPPCSMPATAGRCSPRATPWCGAWSRWTTRPLLLAAAGLTKGMDLAFSEPEVSTYLGLPRSPVRHPHDHALR